ncbi:MAG: LpqN/LpqT family lipoprotein [Mycobacterium sp.]|nr:LpqN/LpqT family lipoprotein [Mycobacterium sp.]
MPVILRSLLVVLTTALLLTGCSRDVPGTAVMAAGAGPETSTGGGDECAAVSAPLSDIPTVDDDEPRLRIPIPQGWQRNSMMDSRVIRYAIVAQDLISDGFAPNAVVTLESVRGTPDPDIVFDENRNNLITMMGASDLETESNSTCGFPSETTSYIAPPMGPAPERPIIMHAVVADTGDTTYLATLTLQTAEGENPTYLRDAQEIVDGFQLLLPSP